MWQRDYELRRRYISAREPFRLRCDTDIYRGADKSLDRPTSQCILFDGENISFDASLVLYIYIYIYIYSTNIPGRAVA